MDIFIAIVRLLGGLAMFLYGIEVMGDGLKNSSGTALKRVLEKVTGNVLIGVLTGTLVTAVIQSSTATIVLTVALIGAGVLNLKQAVSIVMGANIGTTITAQIIRLADIEAGDSILLTLCNPDTLAPVALVVGMILIMFVKKKSTKPIGDICIGFGVLFIGLDLMTGAVDPLAETEAFRTALSSLDNSFLGIVVGMVLTVIVQSSSAMVGMLQALSASGIMTFSMIYPIIMGINLGTCITTAMVCSIGSSKDAKRTGAVHILFNTVGTVVLLIAMSLMEHFSVFGVEFWQRTADSGIIANFQTVFNIITAALLLPFTGLLVKASKRIVRDDSREKVDNPELHTLDEKLYISPAVALNEATKAVAAMGRVAMLNFERGCSQLLEYKEEEHALINKDEEALDQFADLADHFLIGLSKLLESEQDVRQLDLLMQTVPNFERIGDYATNFVELAQKMHDDGTSFSETARQELRILNTAVREVIDLTLEAFTDVDGASAGYIEPLEETIDDMVLMLRDRHTQRLKKGICSVGSGLVFIETLTYMERASDQCSSIGVMMMSQFDEKIQENRYDYLRELHRGDNALYNAERDRRREQYLKPLKELQ